MLTLQLPRARYPATAHADVARQPGACPPAVCQQHVLWTQPRRRLGPVCMCRTLAHARRARARARVSVWRRMVLTGKITASWLRPRDTRLGKVVIARKREFHS